MIAVDYKFATKCVVKSRTWFNIGKLIYLISGGSSEGYKLWNMYSEFDHKNYNETYCYELWSDFDELMPEDFDDEVSDIPNGW